MSRLPKKPNPLTPWLITALSVLFFVVALLCSPTNNHYNPSADNHPTSADNYSDAVRLMPVDVNPITNKEQPYTEKEKERYAADRSDLAAQWATARYTFVGIVMGVLGLILIGFTYWESRKAAYFTERTLFETQNNAAKELRAFIFVSGARLNTNWESSINLISKGQTPAKDIIVKYKAFLAEDPESYSVSFDDGDEFFAAWMPANERVPIPAIDGFNDENVARVECGELFACVAGYVSYYDVFGNQRRSIFRFHNRSIGTAREGIMVRCKKNNKTG